MQLDSVSIRGVLYPSTTKSRRLKVRSPSSIIKHSSDELNGTQHPPALGRVDQPSPRRM